MSALPRHRLEEVLQTANNLRQNYQSLFLPTDAQYSCFKRILKFTLKQLLHISVQLLLSGSVLFEPAEVRVIKTTS